MYRTPRRLPTALRLVIAALSLTLVAAACGSGEAKVASRSGDALDGGQTIVDIAVGDASFSTLVTAVTEADLAGTLAGAGPFTLFAPTNDAFEASLTEAGLTLDDLLADHDLLTTILQNHVISGTVLGDQVVVLDGEILNSLAGNRLPITVEGDTAYIDGVTITGTDILANNGVVHTIDRVLLPPA